MALLRSKLFAGNVFYSLLFGAISTNIEIVYGKRVRYLIPKTTIRHNFTDFSFISRSLKLKTILNNKGSGRPNEKQMNRGMNHVDSRQRIQIQPLISRVSTQSSRRSNIQISRRR